MKSIGAKLRYYRKNKGLTQKQVAEQLEISLRAYQHYETGDRTPPLEKWFELAELFGVSLDDLSVRNTTTESNSESA